MNDQQKVASDLYRLLADALDARQDIQKAYRGLNLVFQRCLEQALAGYRVTLVGTFAKTDYLLKENQASSRLIGMVNDARVRLREKDKLSDEILRDQFLYDYKAICLFVELVMQQPVPVSLSRRFPVPRQQAKPRLLLGESVRMLVEDWDEHYIYGKLDTAGAEESKVSFVDKSRQDAFNGAYLQSLLWKGCQLQLIRPHVGKDAIEAELLILEPDILVDISTIAGCFESYAESPLVALLNKIKPSANTEPIILGNLAGQMLDEELCHEKEDVAYATSVGHFFKSNAVNLAAVSLSSSFHTEAKAQQQHIRKAIRHDLPQLLKRFNAKEVIVEPSFFSEMLGLQGRMDFLQLDHRVLVEQKSGKGGWPQVSPNIPIHQEKHYVQLLLYMLLLRENYREQYNKNHQELHAFLFYSKYSQGLLDLPYAPQLVYRAIRLRNAIAWQECQFTKGGFKILRQLTPEQLNQKGIRGKLWEQYVRPSLEQLLNPVKQASTLELAYYERFLQFVAVEHLLSKVGNKMKENSGFASAWLSSLEEKLQAGNIYERLRLISPASKDKGRTDQVVLGFKEDEEADTSNFRQGDIVVLYPYSTNEEPDIRKTMVFRCTIANISDRSLTLSLRATQVDADVFLRHAEDFWAVEHDFFEASYTSLYRGLHAFLSAPQHRRDLLLLQRKPLVDEQQRLKGDYGPFNELALRVKKAQELFLIIGPPGTGKTSYGLMTTLKEELVSSTESVLLLSFTNRAVDEICGKLVDEGVDFLRIGSRLSCAEEFQPWLLETKTEGLTHVDAIRKLIGETRVIVGTTAAMNGNLSLFQLKSFGLAIIDEASQILEPHLIGLLSALHGRELAIRKMVLIGDHKQLPAVVQQTEAESYVSETVLREIFLTDCRHSFFERLLRCYRDNPQVVYMLRKQGRMHHDIAMFPNMTFYQGQLSEVPLPHQQASLPPVETTDSQRFRFPFIHSVRFAFLAVPSPPTAVSDKVNILEASLIADTVKDIYQRDSLAFSPLVTVGIIVPYRNQIATVRNAIMRFGIPQLSQITIDTVERFQGSQRDYIIYGATVQYHYQLRFLTNNTFEENGQLIDRKLNVAMTRAREHLIVVGNPEILSASPVYSRLLGFVRERHCYFEAGVSECHL